MSNQTFKDRIADRIKELKTLRDEIGLDLHLAGMDLRSEWKDIEKKLPEPGAAADELKDFTGDVLEKLSSQLRQFRARIRQKTREGQVSKIMSTHVSTCTATDSLAQAVTTMWDRDVGSLPVVDSEQKVIGMITDRDAAIAACTRGKRMDEISVGSVMSKQVASCKQEDNVEEALSLMRTRQVRRLPVTDDRGSLVGLVSLNDAARALLGNSGHPGRPTGAGEIASTLTSICPPRSATAASS